MTLTRPEQISQTVVRGIAGLPARLARAVRRLRSETTAPRVQAGALLLLALAALLYVVRPFPRYEYAQVREFGAFAVTRHDRWTGAYERGTTRDGPWRPKLPSER